MLFLLLLIPHLELWIGAVPQAVPHLSGARSQISSTVAGSVGVSLDFLSHCSVPFVWTPIWGQVGRPQDHEAVKGDFAAEAGRHWLALDEERSRDSMVQPAGASARLALFGALPASGQAERELATRICPVQMPAFTCYLQGKSVNNKHISRKEVQKRRTMKCTCVQK